MKDFLDFVEPLIGPGRINSLSQVLLKLTAPGVPDIYQGNELWDLSLVDPDNRRPVDYQVRRELLADLNRRPTPEEILRRSEEGLPKLWVTRQALQLRNRHPEWFGVDGTYRPIHAAGPKADHVVSFARGEGCIAIAVRLPLKLGGAWGSTTIELPEGPWANQLTGESVEGGRVDLAEVLARFPVALLSLEAGEGR
jgi:(1->4)-alpha-D-glucan 1-alpha-D-glucosylmutase